MISSPTMFCLHNPRGLRRELRYDHPMQRTADVTDRFCSTAKAAGKGILGLRSRTPYACVQNVESQRTELTKLSR